MKNMKKYTSDADFKADFEKVYPFVALVGDNGEHIKNRVYTQYYNSFDDMSGKMEDGVLQENDVFVPYGYDIWRIPSSYVLVSAWMNGQTDMLSQLYDFLTSNDHEIKIEKKDYFDRGIFDFDTMGRDCTTNIENGEVWIDDAESDGQSTGFWIWFNQSGDFECAAIDEGWNVFEDYVLVVRYVKKTK